MAKAEYSGGKCGTSVTVVGRNRAEADRLAKNYDHNRLCPACYQAEKDAEHAVAAAAAAEAAQSAGLPALSGSEKQIQWAMTLRQGVLDALDRALVVVRVVGPMDRRAVSRDKQLIHEAESLIDSAITHLPKDEQWLARSTAADLFKALGDQVAIEQLGCVLREQTKAAWWINNNGYPIASLAEALRGDIEQRLAQSTSPVVPSDVVAEAQAEALLKPATDTLSHQVAEIKLQGVRLQVTMAERNDDFRQLMRGLGFHWDGVLWVRVLGVTTGDPVDRLAETAHRIIGAGFMARLYDEEARAKAITGEFSPEQTRWLTKTKGGTYDGWVRIQWPRSDDLYRPAKALPGARYKDGFVYVPAGSIQEAADFAEHYGFSLSAGVRQMLEAHTQALAHGTVITDPRPPAAPIVDRGDRQQLAAQPTEISDELRDQD